jgi:hypothetical protein
LTVPDGPSFCHNEPHPFLNNALLLCCESIIPLPVMFAVTGRLEGGRGVENAGGASLPVSGILADGLRGYLHSNLILQIVTDGRRACTLRGLMIRSGLIAKVRGKEAISFKRRSRFQICNNCPSEGFSSRAPDRSHLVTDRDESLHIEDHFHELLLVIGSNRWSVSSRSMTSCSPGKRADKPWARLFWQAGHFLKA